MSEIEVPISITEKRENRVLFEAVTLQDLAQVLEVLIVVAVIALIKDTAETQQSWLGRMETSETEPGKSPFLHVADMLARDRRSYNIAERNRRDLRKSW